MDIAKTGTHYRLSLLENQSVQASINCAEVVDCCKQASQAAKGQLWIEAALFEPSESRDEVLKAAELRKSSLPFLESAR